MSKNRAVSLAVFCGLGGLACEADQLIDLADGGRPEPAVDLGPPRTYIPPIRPSGDPGDPSVDGDGGGWSWDARAWTYAGDAGWSSSDCADAGPYDQWRPCECPGQSWTELVVDERCLAYPRPGAQCGQFFVREIGHPDCILILTGNGLADACWTQPTPDPELYGADFRVSVNGSPLLPGGQLAFVGDSEQWRWEWPLLLEWPSEGRSERYLLRSGTIHRFGERLHVALSIHEQP